MEAIYKLLKAQETVVERGEEQTQLLGAIKTGLGKFFNFLVKVLPEGQGGTKESGIEDVDDMPGIFP